MAYLNHEKTELDDPEDLKREAAAAPTTFQRWALLTYVLYATVQGKFVGEFEGRFLTDPAERKAFLDQTQRFMRWLDFIGPTHHNVLIVLAMLSAPFFPQSFWWYVLLVSVPMNLIYAALVFQGRRLDAAWR